MADVMNSQDAFAYSSQDVHDYMKYKFLKEPVVNEDTGEVLYERINSTTDLSTAEFNNYIEVVRKWAAENLDIYIPDPNEAVLV